jgi:inner membrane protein
MNSIPMLQDRMKSRSIGVKLIVVCGLALVMMIPAAFVNSVLNERTQRASEVEQEIAAYVGGQQKFLGPTLAIPYRVPPQTEKESTRHGVYIVFPAQATATVKTKTEERRRSLFKVPVFNADLQFESSFDLANVPSAAPLGAEFDWDKAEFIVGVSDPRGAKADGTLTADGKSLTFVPAEIGSSFSNGENEQSKLKLLGVRVPGLAKPNAQFKVTADLRFSGAKRIAVLAYGKTTNVTAQGDWPNPSFDGGFLPATRTTSPNGFQAQWSVPYIARGVAAEGCGDLIGGLDGTSLGISFVQVADHYQSVNRALKYVPLFLGLLFLSYFIFEVTTGKRVHPAQYILVGMAQIIFYLLLLSMAERIGFDWAFLVAGGSTVTLLALNAGWIFESRMQGARAFVGFGLLYSLIYLLLRLQDNALLVGAIASFLAVAATMYLTRKIDWYSSIPVANGSPKPSDERRDFLK